MGAKEHKASQDAKRAAMGIHIKPSRRGLFTKKAQAAGKTVQQYGREKYNAPGVLGEEARFAVNQKKFKR